MEVTWTLVQFLEDRSVEAIPTSWINGDLCYWPPFQKIKLMAAIKKCETPSITWPTHKIKIFRNASYSQYLKARLKIKYIEETGNSDVQSSDTEGKRKRIRKIISSSASSDDDNERFNLPRPPRPPKSSSTPRDKPAVNITEGKYSTGPYVDTSESNAGADIIQHYSSNDQLTTLKNFHPSTSPKTSSSCCCEHGTILKEIKNQQHLLRGLMVEVLTKMEKQNTHQTNTRSHLQEAKESFFIRHQKEFSFPINNESDFEKLENLLSNEDEFNSALSDIKRIGGSNPYDFIKRSFATIVTDQVMINYSVYGRKGKKPFVKLFIYQLFIGAAESDRKQTEMAVQKYLKRCQERISSKENKKQY